MPPMSVGDSPAAEPTSPLTPSASSSTRHPYRMAALDLDGTLLNSKHELSEATVSYLRGLHRRGFVVAIATGRSLACSANVIAELDLFPSESGFPLVCTNGARGVRIQKSHLSGGGDDDKDDGPPSASKTSSSCRQSDSTNSLINGTLEVAEELFHDPVPPDVVDRTLQTARGCDCTTNYYAGHEIYAHCRTDAQRQLTERYATLTKSEDLYRRDVDDAYRSARDAGPPSKLLVLCDTARIDSVASALRSELGTDANVVRGSPPFFVEVLRAGVSKGRGLERLCESMGVPVGRVVAFGDGDNDAEFLEAAGRGLAMKNARATLKERADEVLEWTNDEDGVVRALQRLEEQGMLHFPREDKEEGSECTNGAR